MRAVLRALPLVLIGLLLYLKLRPGEKTAAGAALGGIHFVDVAEKAGIDVVNVCGDARRWYIPESNGNGAAWLDYDGDGDLDLFIGNGGRFQYGDDGQPLEIVRAGHSKLYRNDGRMRFVDVSAETGADRVDWINALAVGDVDDDGDPDLYLGCFGPDVLLRKEGTRFVEASTESGLVNDRWAAGAAFADADLDGDLDLYVANYCEFDPAHPPLDGKRNVMNGVEVAWGPEAENGQGVNVGAPDVYFENDGQGRFRDATVERGLALEKPLCSYACVWSDVDDDGRPDLMVANDLQPCNLFVNRDTGFRDEAVERGFAFNAQGKATSAMGLLVEDFDCDGDFDVLRTNFDLEPNALHVNDGRGYFEDRATTYGLAQPSMDKLGWGGAFFDADRDGDVDILIANGHVMPQAEKIGMSPWLQRTQLYEGLPHRKYTTVWRDATADCGPGFEPLRSARGVAISDPDDDGDLDALVVDIDERPRLLENRSPSGGHWLGLRLRSEHGNRDAYGAKVSVHTKERTWTREVRTTNGLYSAHDPRLLFGLGDVARIESVVIRWPNGVVQVEEHMTVDRYYDIRERVESTR